MQFTNFCSMKQLFTACIICVGVSCSAIAQTDPHFSQSLVHPSIVNPALTGTFDGNVRVTAVFRNQWANISNGFRTYGITADAVTNKNVAVGLSVFNQGTGTGYVYQNAYASFAYTGVKFGRENTKQLTFALQAGYINKRFDKSKFETGEQWNNITGYNGTAPANETLPTNSSMVFDAGAGILYYDIAADKRMNPFAGFSVSHLTSPEESFFSKGKKTRLPVKITAHASVNYYVTDEVIITPSFLFMQQGEAREMMAGIFLRKSISETTSLLGGVNYRYEDAFVPAVGIEYNSVKIVASYDAAVSDITSIYNTNSFELSLSYIYKKKELPRGLKCPVF
jgi:type IX secretion system PorP/SprF family membrane protein